MLYVGKAIISAQSSVLAEPGYNVNSILFEARRLAAPIEGPLGFYLRRLVARPADSFCCSTALSEPALRGGGGVYSAPPQVCIGPDLVLSCEWVSLCAEQHNLPESEPLRIPGSKSTGGAGSTQLQRGALVSQTTPPPLRPAVCAMLGQIRPSYSRLKTTFVCACL